MTPAASPQHRLSPALALPNSPAAPAATAPGNPAC